MKGLTGRQSQVLAAISESIRTTGYPPTIREIGVVLNIRSTNGVNDHLKALERKGYITRDTSKSRAIILTELGAAEAGLQPAIATADDTTMAIPVLGDIAAGVPIAAIEHSDERLRLDRSLFGRSPGDVFALNVSGDSMIEDGIFDGDMIFVRRQPVAERGATVAAMIDGEATVKRYQPEGDRIRLVPANSAMDDIVITPGEARESVILGRVVGVFRRLN